MEASQGERPGIRGGEGEGGDDGGGVEDEALPKPKRRALKAWKFVKTLVQFDPNAVYLDDDTANLESIFDTQVTSN